MSFGRDFLDLSSGLHGSDERGGCRMPGGVGGVDPGLPAPPPVCWGGVPPGVELAPGPPPGLPPPGGGVVEVVLLLLTQCLLLIQCLLLKDYPLDDSID